VTTEKNKALIRELFERAINERELEVADRIVSADFVDRSARPGSVARGPESIRDFVTRMVDGLPDAKATIEEMIAEGDRVVIRICTTGTPPNGAAIRVRGSVWWRIADGKIAERWGAHFATERDEP
jgi:predicted SnoaL-like aldol condensation-catalyzing enzyme